MHEANEVVSKLKSQKVVSKFPCLGDPNNLKIKAYSDATYANLEDGLSQGGFIIFVEGNNNRVIPIFCQSKKLNHVTKSPLASEMEFL